MTEHQVWAVGMVRDEADVIGHTIDHLVAEGVDGIIVADNMSVDGSAEVIAAAGDRASVPVIVTTDTERGYWQSAKMTALAARAVELGAEWIVPFDADEVWLAADRISVLLRGMPADVDVVAADLFNHFPTALDPAGTNPFETIRYRQRAPGALPKVAFRWRPGAVIHQGNHGVFLPGGAVTSGGLEIRHFPYRSFEQFVRKARNGAEAYAATDLGPEVGAHWRQYGELLERHGESALREVFERWYWFLSPVDGGLVLDPAAWCRWT